MKRYLIERDIPGVGKLNSEDLKGAAAKSNEALAKLAGRAQWLESFVVEDKTFCVYLAENEAAVHEHAKLSGFPASKVTEVRNVIDPMTARGWPIGSTAGGPAPPASRPPEAVPMTRAARQRRPPPSLASRSDPVLEVVVVLLGEGYASTAIGPVEVFHSAGVLWNWLHDEPQRPRFRVRTASVDGKSVASLCSVGLKPECSIHEVKRADIIVLPASGKDLEAHVVQNTPLQRWLRRWHDKGAYVAGICTGVASLAAAGLLDGRRATTHWAVADLMRQRFPRVNWQPEQFVTEDDRVMCSGGVYSAIDLSLYLVEKFCGHEVALQTAKSLLVSMPRGRQSGYAVLPLSRPHDDDRIRDAEDWLRQNFDSDVSIETLAGRIGMSTRNFIRRFKSATGRLPGAYVQGLRIAAARDMLERGAPSIQTVCSKVGYEDIAYFRGLFKRHTGMTPVEYRARFAGMTFGREDLASNA